MSKQVLLGCLPTIGSSGDFQVSQDIEVILQSIYVILNTPKGSRIWQPKFGCNLKNYVWDLLDDTTFENIQESVRNALEQWEPRISVNDVEVDKVDDVSKTISVKITFSYAGNQYTKVFNTSSNSNLTVYDILA